MRRIAKVRGPSGRELHLDLGERPAPVRLIFADRPDPDARAAALDRVAELMARLLDDPPPR